MRHLRLAVLLACCPALIWVAAPAATAASGGITLTVSKTTTLTGKKLHFSGQVTSSGANRRIVLQRKTGKGWHDLTRHHTDSAGDFHFKFIPAAPGHINFRVAALTSRGATTATSNLVPVTVLQWHYLSDLQGLDSSISYYYDAVEINGHSYVHSVYLHGQSGAGDGGYVEYNLERRCRSFKSTFGVTDDSDASTPVDFAVSGDGNQLYSTEQSLGESVTNTIDISGHLRLRIGDTLPTDDPKEYRGVFPAFGNAEILCSF